ncbi:MAG: SRPBCC family protein [Myxococcaceae bacterium]|nr:SRPBCC family protein [Myxococcaceae bacterium]
MPIVRQTPDFHTLTPDGRATERKDPGSLAYQVAVEVNAPAERVMATLTRGGWTKWTSTLTRFEGEVKQGGRVTLESTLSPGRAFRLKVSQVGNDSMVFEDGMPLGLFRGVRTYRATAAGEGRCVFAMCEVFSGVMLGMIAKSLPDQRASFEQFAKDLKKEVENPR